MRIVCGTGITLPEPNQYMLGTNLLSKVKQNESCVWEEKKYKAWVNILHFEVFLVNIEATKETDASPFPSYETS